MLLYLERSRVGTSCQYLFIWIVTSLRWREQNWTGNTSYLVLYIFWDFTAKMAQGKRVNFQCVRTRNRSGLLVVQRNWTSLNARWTRSQALLESWSLITSLEHAFTVLEKKIIKWMFFFCELLQLAKKMIDREKEIPRFEESDFKEFLVLTKYNNKVNC
jgi:hypothetical protein